MYAKSDRDTVQIMSSGEFQLNLAVFFSMKLIESESLSNIDIFLAHDFGIWKVITLFTFHKYFS